jgi:hypothetical protein
MIARVTICRQIACCAGPLAREPYNHRRSTAGSWAPCWSAPPAPFFM